jgi:hypothetical protein
MGTFSQFLDEKKITPQMIVRISARLEASGKDGRKLLVSRAVKRRTDAQKSYADAGLAKPPTDRGVSVSHIKQAVEDLPLPRKVRTKMVRALTALTAKKGGAALDAKAVFGEVPAKKGKKVEKAAVA